MERVTIYSTAEQRTPEQEYKNASRWWREVSANRDRTQLELQALEHGAIYRLYEQDNCLWIHRLEVLKATPKQYRVRDIGYTITLSRALIDGEQIATNGQERYALGSTILPRLQEQLESQTRGVEYCAAKMEEKRQALGEQP